MLLNDQPTTGQSFTLSEIFLFIGKSGGFTERLFFKTSSFVQVVKQAVFVTMSLRLPYVNKPSPECSLHKLGGLKMDCLKLADHVTPSVRLKEILGDKYWHLHVQHTIKTILNIGK